MEFKALGYTMELSFKVMKRALPLFSMKMKTKNKRNYQRKMAQEEEIIAKVGIDTGDSDKQLESVKQGVEDIGDATEKTAKKSPKLVKGVKAIGTSFKKNCWCCWCSILITEGF